MSSLSQKNGGSEQEPNKEFPFGDTLLIKIALIRVGTVVLGPLRADKQRQESWLPLFLEWHEIKNFS